MTQSGWLRDRDGEPDVVLLIMMLVGFAGLATIVFALFEAWSTIGHLNAKQGTDPVAHANGIAAVLTATGGFIQSVLLGISAFGLAVAGYQWTDAANKRAYAQPAMPPAQTVIAPQASVVAQVQPQPAEAATDVESPITKPKKGKKP